MEAASTIEDGVRPGLAGTWDRFVGPGQTPVESWPARWWRWAQGPLWGDLALDEDASWPARAAMRLAAVDLWGGLWVNNIRTCARWYERPGQGAVEHLGFASLHIVHAGVVAGIDVATGTRSTRSAAVWTLGHYAWMLASSTVTVAAPLGHDSVSRRPRPSAPWCLTGSSGHRARLPGSPPSSTASCWSAMPRAASGPDRGRTSDSGNYSGSSTSVGPAGSSRVVKTSSRARSS